jgi:nicotinate dehydrogenase subunit B
MMAKQSRQGSGRREASWGQVSTWLDDWLAINPDGTVTAFSGKVELGTGVRTALAQIVAEELDLPLECVQMVMGDTDRTPNEGYTAGSMTINSSGGALRNAAALARRILLERAAERLDARPEELTVQAGLISLIGDPKRKVSYAELRGANRSNVK